jgi:hypothetical protein
MGIFDIFKKPTIIEDDIFGRLRFMKMKDPEKGYFEGDGLFKPTGKKIEYLIDGNENGPDQNQKEFYRWIQENYRELVTKILPLVEDEFENWKVGFKITNFDKEFELVGVTIPKQDKTALKWEMSFNTIHDENHQITIGFIGSEPKRVLIDG